MVRYSAKASVSLAYLKRGANDIDIYVEDTANPNMWVRFIRNMLPSSVRLDTVSVLGGRDQVIAACKENQSRNDRPKLFIIDADLDLLHGRRRPNLQNLFRLRRYCIENYLLSEVALSQVMATIDPIIPEYDAKTKLDLTGWFEKNELCLSRLFVCYAVCKKLDPCIKSVGFSVHKLTKEQDKSTLCSLKVSRRVYCIYKSLCKNHGSASVRSVYANINDIAARRRIVEYVSAKDYILPLLYIHIKGVCKFNIGMESMKVMIASHADVSDHFLLRRLRTLLE